MKRGQVSTCPRSSRSFLIRDPRIGDLKILEYVAVLIRHVHFERIGILSMNPDDHLERSIFIPGDRVLVRSL